MGNDLGAQSDIAINQRIQQINEPSDAHAVKTCQSAQQHEAGEIEVLSSGRDRSCGQADEQNVGAEVKINIQKVSFDAGPGKRDSCQANQHAIEQCNGINGARFKKSECFNLYSTPSRQR